MREKSWSRRRGREVFGEREERKLRENEMKREKCENGMLSNESGLVRLVKWGLISESD